MSKYQPFAQRLNALFENASIAYLGGFAALRDARKAVEDAKAPAEAYKARNACAQAQKEWDESGGEHIALSFEYESNALADELHKQIVQDERGSVLEFDAEAAETIRHTTDPDALRQMVERFRGNQTMLRVIAHHIENAVDYICVADLPNDQRNALRKLHSSFRTEEDGKEREFQRLVDAYQTAAGCEMSVSALRNGKACWELDEAKRKAAAEF